MASYVGTQVLDQGITRGFYSRFDGKLALNSSCSNPARAQSATTCNPGAGACLRKLCPRSLESRPGTHPAVLSLPRPCTLAQLNYPMECL